MERSLQVIYLFFLFRQIKSDNLHNEVVISIPKWDAPRPDSWCTCACGIQKVPWAFEWTFYDTRRPIRQTVPRF